MALTKDFDVDKERWENNLSEKFLAADLEYIVGSSQTNKNRVVIMVELQHASKALEILRNGD